MAKHHTRDSIEFDQGYHGIAPEIPPQMAEYLYDTKHLYSITDEVNCSTNPPEAFQDQNLMCQNLENRWPESALSDNSCIGRVNEQSNDLHTVDVPLYIEFVNFGFHHSYPASEFKNLASLWRQKLMTEESLLFDSINYSKKIWEDLYGGFWGGTVTVTASLKEKWHSLWNKGDEKNKAIDVKEYDKLLDRLKKVYRERLQQPSEILYEDIHEAGVAFEEIRKDLNELDRGGLRHREKLIDAAQQDLEIASAVEWAAFYFNDKAAELAAHLSGGGAVKKAAYRMAAVLAPKMLGTGAGEYLAAVQGKDGWAMDSNETRSMFRNCSKIFAEDCGDILGDLGAELIEKRPAIESSAFDSSQKELIKGIVKLIIITAFEVSDTAIWEKEKLGTDEFSEELIGGLVKEFSTIFTVSFVRIGGKEITADTFGSIAKEITGELKECIKEAEAQGRPLAPIVLHKMPVMLAMAMFAIFTEKYLHKPGRFKTGPHHDPSPKPSKPAKQPTKDEIKKVKKVKRKMQNESRKRNRRKK